MSRLLTRSKIPMIPQEWRNMLVLIIQSRGDVQRCGDYRGIELKNCTMRLYKREMGASLAMCDQEYLQEGTERSTRQW